jgi:acetone carboxylase gamma subunit
MDKIEKYLTAINRKTTEEKILLVTNLVLRDRLAFSDIITINMSSIMEQLQYVFPNRWDIQFERCFAIKDKIVLKAEFVIHFPKIVISNSEEMKHTIHDLYIKLQSIQAYNGVGITFDDFKGKRMTVTDEEVLSKYQHSHLPSRPYTEIKKTREASKFSSYGQTGDSNAVFTYRNFCKGSSEINQILSMLSSRYDSNIFKMFLLQLDLYVQWESIEGRPHIYMKYVSGRAEINHPSSYKQQEFYDYLPLWEMNINFKVENGEIKVIDNNKFEDFLKYKGDVSGVYPVDIRNTLCIKDEKGNYYSRRSLPTEFPDALLDPVEELNTISWYFKGELIEFKVIYQSEEERALNAEKPFFIHKDLKEYAKSRIEQTIKTQRFRCYISEQLSKANNPTRSI